MPKPETTLPPQEVNPDPALEKRARRVLSADYKLRILREADACARGELGELLRREKLYHAQLSQWRREFAESGVEGLSKSAPGPKSVMTAESKRITQLEKENQRLQQQLLVKDHCLELQKKSFVLDRRLRPGEPDMITIVESRPPIVPLRTACHALGLNRSTLSARRDSASRSINPDNQKKTVITSARALSSTERQQVIETLNSEAYADQPPAQVYYRLLQEGTYLCSISTMHRLLRARDQHGDRRPQRAPATQPIPRLMACHPNEVWTWDVSKLALQTRGVYLSLYVVMDLYSRYIVAWMVSRKENSALAQQLFREATDRYQIERLTVHQDRGAPMIANAYLDLLSELSITASHSRPRVSNDNPMSESQFKTMKYQPDYPRRFQSLEHARLWCEDYVHWYNFSHHHTGIASFTPSQVFTGQHVEVAQRRQEALDLAFLRHPERFVSGPPKVTLPPSTVYINPVLDLDGRPDPAASVNFPTLGRVKAKLT